MVIPPAPPPPPIQGSRAAPMVQPGCCPSSPVSQPILSYSTAASPSVSIGGLDNSYVQQRTSRMARSATDYEPVRSIDTNLSYGSMDRPYKRSSPNVWSDNTIPSTLPIHTARTQIPSPTVDTDLALSLVNETRPSYELKTAGKRPLSESHLMALVDSKLEKHYSPSHTYTTRLQSHQTVMEPIKVHTNMAAAPRPSSADYGPPPRAPSGTPVREFNPESFCRELRESSLSPRKTPTPKPSARYRTPSPMRSPRYHGNRPPPVVDGDVDSLTQRMIYNMDTFYGAAGDCQSDSFQGPFLLEDAEQIYNCAKCGEGISLERAGCTALNQTFHLDCFICTACGCRLAGGSFYAVDGKPYCEKDYIETLEKCTICNEAIMDRILRASGKAFHPQCFVCTVCSTCLDGVPFTVDSNNQVHCVQCFHEKYAPRCAVCNKPIVPEEGKEESLRVVAMDKSFHVSCYKCEDCGMKLSSKIEGHGCYPLDGHLYCKTCNAERVRKLTA